MILKYGTTRVVFLTKRYAIKFPALVEWRLFLLGLLGNIHERKWSILQRYCDKLCPVVYANRYGLVLIMLRAKPLSREQYFDIDFNDFQKGDGFILPIENKQDSFGYLNGRIVAVDYGS